MRRLRSVLPLLLLVMVVAAHPVRAQGPAQLVLAQEVRDDGTRRITATVTDGAGKAVQGAAITFRVKTAFGWLDAGEVETGPAGTASIILPAERRYADVRAEADSAAATLSLGEVARPEPIKRPGAERLRALSPQPGLISPYPPVQILFIAVLVGGVWMTYAYVVSLLARIARTR